MFKCPFIYIHVRDAKESMYMWLENLQIESTCSVSILEI